MQVVECCCWACRFAGRAGWNSGHKAGALRQRGVDFLKIFLPLMLKVNYMDDVGIAFCPHCGNMAPQKLLSYSISLNNSEGGAFQIVA